MSAPEPLVLIPATFLPAADAASPIDCLPFEPALVATADPLPSSAVLQGLDIVDDGGDWVI